MGQMVRKGASGSGAQPPYNGDTLKHARVRQTFRLQDIKDALATSGLVTLDEQAKALGLSRSTAWTILRANHKTSGLSAKTIKRILASRQLPPLVRATVLQYVKEKTAGLYGHSAKPMRKFSSAVQNCTSENFASVIPKARPST
jgi:hypothetical protein